MPSAAPLVPPYLLGSWLGDGGRGPSTITTADEDVVAAIRGLGCTVTQVAGVLRYRIWLPGGILLSPALRHLGVLDHKRIPLQYLRGPLPYRWELLAGLLDSDGTVGVGVGGIVQFTSTSRELAQDFHELVDRRF